MTAHHLTPGQVRSGARHHAPPVEARCNLSTLSDDRVSLIFWFVVLTIIFSAPLVLALFLRQFD